MRLLDTGRNLGWLHFLCSKAPPMARRHQQVKEGAWVTRDHVRDPHLSFHGKPESTRSSSYPMHRLTGWGLGGARAGHTVLGNVS